MSVGTSPQPAAKKEPGKRKRRSRTPTDTPKQAPTPLITEPTMTIQRLVVISLGNPGEMRNTYHSAGHIVLEALQRALGPSQPSFSSQRIGKLNTLASIGSQYSLLQSPAIMNVTGPWAAAAYRQQLVDSRLGAAEVGVVLVHDDLEEELGVIKVREWKRSPRGHNGVKSVHAALGANPAVGKWARVSVGIGRPDARDKTAVSNFVLSKVPRATRSVLEDNGSRGLYQALAELNTKWGG
ncbi:peptidyl-tRNA hydrolase [Chaetomium tenue]|uniref:Peptidyl-tRNA hydrolase n=1 Tax=Chaetomium tenue TaxID=1854479 RepID=A0ACB7PM51_9PEZI|nr:peptidyl-tRNA hydrolase [Chaetomium globosum]